MSRERAIEHAEKLNDDLLTYTRAAMDMRLMASSDVAVIAEARERILVNFVTDVVRLPWLIPTTEAERTIRRLTDLRDDIAGHTEIYDVVRKDLRS